MTVTENNSPKIEQILLDLLSNSMFGANRKIECDSVKWSLVWHEAYVQAVSLLAFSGESPENCDDALLLKIREKLKDDVRSVIHVNKQHIRLHNILTNAGIPYVILKGAASAAYYKDPLLRSMGDVDFLVDEADVGRACKALEENGLAKNPKEHEKHIVYYDDEGNFEMHIVPAGVPKGEKGEDVKKLLENILADSCEYKTAFGTICVPSEFHHGLVILLHTCSHLTSEGIGLRQLCDWAAFVSNLNDEEFCKLFEEELKSVVDGIIADVFKNGNLGQKNADSVKESLLVTTEKSKRAVIKHFISSVNEIVYFYWQFTKKFKILLPLGWLFIGTRYLFNVLRGKRSGINIKKLKSGTATRTSLYEKIELFQ